MAKKVPFVDPETCIGCSACSAVCPDVFEMQEDGKSKAVNEASDSEENIQNAIDTCPVQAIRWKQKNEPAEKG
ncbi:ferredoxin [Candidatus Micrarchaeota archaeon]|nr:ferredoxin [Candidatus Micrarchaeota archaeon]